MDPSQLLRAPCRASLPAEDQACASPLPVLISLAAGSKDTAVLLKRKQPSTGEPQLLENQSDPGIKPMPSAAWATFFQLLSEPRVGISSSCHDWCIVCELRNQDHAFWE